jgi:hypothetical protein
MNENKIQVEQKDLYIFLISEMRYAMERDNHLAPFTFISMYKKYINQFSNEYQKIIKTQLKGEINFNLALKDYDWKQYWKDFIYEYLGDV